MAFISGKSKNKDNVPYFHLFVPTTPNPTSGFFLMIPQADTISTGMTVEQGLKTIISGGLLAPSKNPYPRKELKLLTNTKMYGPRIPYPISISPAIINSYYTYHRKRNS